MLVLINNTYHFKKKRDLTKDFLWHGNKDMKSFHLVNWNTVILDKKTGGLGERGLNGHKKSLMCKMVMEIQL